MRLVEALVGTQKVTRLALERARYSWIELRVSELARNMAGSEVLRCRANDVVLRRGGASIFFFHFLLVSAIRCMGVAPGCVNVIFTFFLYFPCIVLNAHLEIVIHLFSVRALMQPCPDACDNGKYLHCVITTRRSGSFQHEAPFYQSHLSSDSYTNLVGMCRAGTTRHDDPYGMATLNFCVSFVLAFTLAPFNLLKVRFGTFIYFNTKWL